MIKTIFYKQEEQNIQMVYYLDDDNEADLIPKDVPYYFLSDELIESMKNIPFDVWEVEGEPDGYGKQGDKDGKEDNSESGKTTGTESGGSKEEEEQVIDRQSRQNKRDTLGINEPETAGSVDDLSPETA